MCSQLYNQNGYVLVSINSTANMPAACDPGCMTCSAANPSFCSACNAGYYLSSGTCMACSVSSLCMTCSSSNSGMCLTCFPGSSLSSSNTCVQCQSPCASCQNDNPSACTSCPIGYALQSNTCVSFSTFNNTVQATLQNCAIANTINGLGYCSLCLLGSTLTSGQVCAPCISGCLICTPSQITTCTTCTPGYYLNSQLNCTSCSTACDSCGGPNIGCK